VDGSIAVAEASGARVSHRAWTDDFSAARNAALDQATGDWILYIDADERLAPTSRAAVEHLLTSGREVAFRVLFRPVVGATPYREFRLWRNDPAIRFCNVIHETVIPAITAVGERDDRPIGVTDVVLLEHVGYEGEQTRKHLRNLPLLRRQVVLTPENLFVWHHLARVLRGLGFDAEAERALVSAVEVARAKPGVDPLGVLAYSDLIAVHMEAGRPVRPLLAEARGRYPDNWVLAGLEGRLLIDEERYEEAVALFERIAAVRVGELPDFGPSYDQRIFGELAHHHRAIGLFRLGRYEEAAAAWGEAERLAADPEAGYRARRQLAEARARVS
jgi:tetratricopeptide (TPR) repeat protein